MKRKKLRKKSKQKISTIQIKIWNECRRILGIRLADKNGKVDCFTCNAKDLQGSNRQLGHLWSKASLGAYMKYDLRILKWQCSGCNIWQGGRGADFYARMLRENGQEYMEKLEKDRQMTVPAYDYYFSLLDRYRLIKL